MELSYFQIWTLGASFITIFAFIVGIFSVWNGRMTRREITNLIESESRESRKLLERMEQRFGIQLERSGEILEKMDQRAEERHREVMAK